MDTPAIRIENLSKTFGWRASRQVRAVQNISLTVPRGQVYGFLGPNGAGKTTTIRMMLDLIRPSAGDVWLFGQHVRRERAVLGGVGSLVEGAHFYNFTTGWQNLRLLMLASNLDPDPEQIERLLQQVGMLERAQRRVRGYSTGMKQRLGLAAALIGDPDLIILDEPTNGLDPQGIREVRLFIRELVDRQGKTVFLSSHILTEVEQVCDRVAIINLGQIVREGSVEALLADQTLLRVRATPIETSAELIAQRWTVASRENGAVLVRAAEQATPSIVAHLVAGGAAVYEVTRQRRTLEEYFLEVTQGEEPHVAPPVLG